MTMSKKVILLTVDSLRADHLSCLGYDKPTTPNIDALAKNGVSFSQAFSNGGGSVTSFPSIMTSTYASMNTLSNIPNLFWIKLSEKWPTIAEVLKHEGFSTAAFKNFKDDLCSLFSYDKGFDLFDETIHFYDKTMAKLHTRLRFLRGKKFVRAKEINRKAISWCTHKEDNFFLWLHYMDVHLPYSPRHLSIRNRIQAIKLGEKNKKKPDQLSQKDIETLKGFWTKKL